MSARSRSEDGDHDSKRQSSCKGNAQQANRATRPNRATRQDIGENRPCTNEDEAECPDEFSNYRLHVLLAGLAPRLVVGDRLVSAGCHDRLSIAGALDSPLRLLVPYFFAHIVSFPVISKVFLIERQSIP